MESSDIAVALFGICFAAYSLCLLIADYRRQKRIRETHRLTTTTWKRRA